MLEVSLYSIPADDMGSRVGRCLSRYRFDREPMGITVEEFVMGFLRDNLDKIEAKGNELSRIISNKNKTILRRDISCINYYLSKNGLMIKVFNVADDEENANGVPSGDVVEWNVIDNNFVQEGYPTATKFMPPSNQSVSKTLRSVIEKSGLFNSNKFSGLVNPFTTLLDNLDRVESVTGTVSSAIVGKIYQTLSDLGIEVFCATSEN